jgi:hypothetical protein
MPRKNVIKSAKQMISELKSGGPSFFGMVKENTSDDTQIMFARGHDCARWIPIPVESIDEIEMLHPVPCGDHEHPFVRVRLKPPTHPEGTLFSQLAALHAAPLSSDRSLAALQAARITSFGPDPHLCWDAARNRYIPC